MTWTDESLKEFGWNIQKLIDKKDLTRHESYRMFCEVLNDRQPDLQQGAFLAALGAKGETPREIAGAWEAIFELDTRKVEGEFKAPLVENSGTGMDHLKTFNVSTAASIIAAAGGAVMARHGSRALTSKCGTVDLLEAVGVNVDCEVEQAADSIRKTGIGIFNGMSSKVHPQALGRILSQIRFGSILNIAASLASPCKPTHALRGVYSEPVIAKVAEVMKEIGYRKAMVVHGYDGDREFGMDELSTIGESVVKEFTHDGRENDFVFAPEDVGLSRRKFEDIAAGDDVRGEAVRFMKVIAGRAHHACIDFACLNAGAIFYLTGEVDSIKAGIEKSRSIVQSGAALKKLAEWTTVQGDSEKHGVLRLLAVSEAAGLKSEVAALI